MTFDPNDDGSGKKPVTHTRLIIWLLVGGAGAYLVLTGLIGVISKGG